jgi:CRISPR-associated protein Csh2
MSTPFKNRAFGCVIVKSINSNYNADFTHQPRTLNDGTVYATDKVLKYSVRNFMNKAFSGEKLFYFKSLSSELQPLSIGEMYNKFFNEIPKGKEGEVRKTLAKNLLSCIDVRLFGGTYAGDKISLSIHGPVQITHGVNRFPENVIYSEQIMSPFRNQNDKNADSTMTTLGSQSKLKEGHYVHHFSINPQNIEELVMLSGGTSLSTDDVVKLKAGLSRGVTLYDSAAKAGTENELMLYVQLKEGSFLVLPSFVRMIDVKNDDKRTIDLSRVSELLAQPQVKAVVDKIELYYDKSSTTVENAPEGASIHPINA